MCDCCRFCGGPDVESGKPTNSGTCGECYYQMRFDPDGFERRMQKIGRYVLGRAGCVLEEFPDGSSVISCRDPYTPGLFSVPMDGDSDE